MARITRDEIKRAQNAVNTLLKQKGSKYGVFCSYRYDYMAIDKANMPDDVTTMGHEHTGGHGAIRSGLTKRGCLDYLIAMYNTLCLLSDD